MTPQQKEQHRRNEEAFARDKSNAQLFLLLVVAFIAVIIISNL